MWNRRTMICLMLASSLSAAALADTRIVQESHHDAFAVLGQEQPAFDANRVIWFAADRLRMDEMGVSFIVRADRQLLYVVDHDHRTVSSVELPIDLQNLLPQGVAERMLGMLELEVRVTPSQETKTVGPWQSRRYDVVMTSKMATVTNVMWATSDLDVDREAYFGLFQQIVSLQPGMADVLTAIRSIDGFIVEEQSVTTMPMTGDVEMRSVDRTVSVDTMDPPEGHYEPPADYQVKDFDLLAAMQGK